MEKRAIYLIFIITLITLIIFSVISFYKYTKQEIKQDSFCLLDSDCIKTQISCCPCSSGGQEICILKSEQEVYIRQLENCSIRTICAQVYNCNQKTCGCLNKKCVEV